MWYNDSMKKIVVVFFAVLVQARLAIGRELPRELERECAKDGTCVLPDASRATGYVICGNALAFGDEMTVGTFLRKETA